METDPESTGDRHEEEAALRIFFQHYSRGEFYECHDVLEDLWLSMGARRRTFYQGLLQASVARLQAERGNHRAAGILYRECSEKLKPYRPNFMGVDLEGFLAELEANLPNSVIALD